MAEPSFGAQAIAYKRIEQCMSQRSLSLDAGLSESYVGKYESGEIHDISLRYFARLAHALGMTGAEVAAVIRREALDEHARDAAAAERLEQPFTVTPSAYGETR